MEQYLATVRFGEFLLEFISRHVVLAAAINHDRAFGPQPLRLGHGVNRGITSADDGDATADRNMMERLRMDPLDKIERLEHFVQIFARNVHARTAAESHANKNRIK